MSLADDHAERAALALSAQDASAQATMAFLLRMRARGLGDLNVLRALETSPRLAFVPHRFADLALRDMALPIPCGQTMSEPFELAKILEKLNLDRSHRVLEVGTGSGYGTALLARLAGEVLSYERFRSLSTEAALRLRGLHVTNARVELADGLSIGNEVGLFDRIFIDAAVVADQLPIFLERLAVNGVMILSLLEGDKRRLVKIAHGADGFTRLDLGPSKAASLLPDVSRAL